MIYKVENLLSRQIPLPSHPFGPDQAQEHLNKVHKGDGAISGITTYLQGLLKFCLSSPELARLAGETEQMQKPEQRNTISILQHDKSKQYGN